jgi:hypothetical protein
MNNNNNSGSSGGSNKAATTFINLLNNNTNNNNNTNKNANNNTTASCPGCNSCAVLATTTIMALEPPPALLLPEYNIASARYHWHMPGRLPTTELQALYQLRDVQDQIRVLTNFNLVPELSFPGNILELLSKLVPYPVPARLPLLLSAAFTAESPPPTHFFADNVEIGVCAINKHDKFDVDLPWYLRTFELHTDWRSLPNFTRQPPLRVMQMLDQLCLESQSLTMATSAMEDKPFPAPVDAMPLHQIQMLSNNYPEEIVLEILRDFGIITRSALSELPHTVLASIQTGRKILVNRDLLSGLYQKSTLRWLIKRYGYDRLLP